MKIKPQTFCTTFVGLLLFILSNGILGQTQKKALGVNITLSEEKGGLWQTGYSVIGRDQDFLYTRGGSSGLPFMNKLILSKFDENLNLVISNNIKSHPMDYNVFLPDNGEMRLSDGKIIHVTIQELEQENSTAILLSTYDKNALEFIETKEIARIDHFDKKYNRFYFSNSEFASDKIGLLIVSGNSSQGTATLVVVNNEMVNEIFQIAFDHEIGEIDISDIQINERNASFFTKKKNKVTKQEEFTFHYQIEGKKGNYSLPLQLCNDDQNIDDVSATITSNAIQFSGFYDVENKTNPSEGAFTQIYSTENGQLLSEHYMAFDFEFRTQNFTPEKKAIVKEKEANGYKGGFSFYKVKNIYLNEDGSALLVGEISRRAAIHRATMYSITHEEIYYFGDIIYMKLSAEGDIDWIQSLPKKNNEHGYSAESYIDYDTRKAHYTLFRQAERILLTRLDKLTGEYEIQTVFDSETVGNLVLTPNFGIKLVDNSLYVPFLAIFQYRMLLLEFKH